MSLVASSIAPSSWRLLRLALVASWPFLLSPLGAATASAQVTAPDRVEESVLRISVSKRAGDSAAPWQFEEVEQQSHLGVLLEGGRILTTAFAIADATFIEGQRFGSSRKIALAKVFADYEVNLAILAPSAEKDLAGMRPLGLGDDLEVNASVEIYKARDAYQLARLPASLQEVGIFSSVTSSYSLASYLLKAQQTGLGWSEPVLRGGRLIAIATGQDNNYVYATPASIIRHFIEDRHGPDYRGFPAIGVNLASLVSPELRRMLKADTTAEGVRISRVARGGPFSDLLRENDVLLSFDGVILSEHGFYTHPKWGKMHLKHLLNRRYGGDEVTLGILREGRPLEIRGRLPRFDSNRGRVVIQRYDQPIPHLIFGGLVFQELSRAYLRLWGRDWEDTAPLDLLYAYNERAEPTDDPTERIVVVTRVLPDVFNRGYAEMGRQIVQSVNGRRITSLAVLREAMARPVLRGGRQYARIQLESDGGEVILGYDGLAAAHGRIAQTYAIKTPQSFFTP